MLFSIIASLRWYYPVQVMRVIEYSQLKAPLATINFEYGLFYISIKFLSTGLRRVEYIELT
jgi:hypothetical protein